MSYGFFLSYARADEQGEGYVAKFLEDLRKDLNLRSKLGVAELGYMDVEMEPGTVWGEKLATALSTSRAMVCLVSPNYVSSDYCGKEFSVFSERVEAFRKASNLNDTPSLLVPVLWGPPDPKFPQAITRLQYAGSGSYASDGLRYLMTIDANKDEYAQFVKELGEAIHGAAQTHALGPLAQIPALEKVTSAFKPGPTSPPAKRSPGGPGRVNFVYVAGNPAEMAAVRQSVEDYQPDGGPYWKPYSDSQVKLLAQEVSTKSRLFYEELPFGANLEQRLRQFEKDREVVVLLVDPWVTQLQEYETILSDFDRINFENCGALVLWNVQDPELSSSEVKLDQSVSNVFKFKGKQRNTPYFQKRIENQSQLRTRMAKTIARLQGQLASSTPVRTASSDKLQKQADARGTQIDATPIVSGPGGTPS